MRSDGGGGGGFEAPPVGSGNARLGLAVLAMAPALGATYASALIERRRFATERGAREALGLLGLAGRSGGAGRGGASGDAGRGGDALAIGDELARGPQDVRVLGSGKSNAVIAVRFASGRQIVVKKALAFGSLMAWGARHFGANYVYAARTSGAARIAREAEALRVLAAHGVAVPAVIAAAPEHGLLALAWVDGAPAATALHGPDGEALAREIGALLHRVHALGVTLADGHPGNMLVVASSASGSVSGSGSALGSGSGSASGSASAFGSASGSGSGSASAFGSASGSGSGSASESGSASASGSGSGARSSEPGSGSGSVSGSGSASASGSGRLVLFDLEFAECTGSTPARRGFDLAYAAVLMPTPALRDAMLAAYGPRSAAEAAAIVVAERHLRRFARLLEMERARWTPAAAAR